MIMNEKIVVIGSNSFSGASFVDFGLNMGYSVIGVSRSQPPNRLFLPYINNRLVDEYYTFYQMDLNHDLDKIADLMEKEKPDYIVNFAAQGMVAESWLHPEHWFMTNAVAVTRLFNRLKDFDFIKKYVHIATPEVYGNCPNYVREDQPYNPSTPYAASRAAGDMSLKTFIDNYNFPAVYTRAANVYGIGQQLYRIIPRTIMYIKQKRRLQLHGGGISERSFVHIRDVADATLKVALQGDIGDVYHIATESTVTIKSIVEMICNKMGVDFYDVVDIADERLGKDAAYLIDSTKIRKNIGWSDVVSLEQGVDEVIEWIDSNFDVLKNQNDTYIHKP
ncbi:NAD-dependent epimerase/dehydratase family protein [Ectothiorhodospiraceae bacterium BW-2]|nr:NAD-dependent epimerase/dehydratase family protein [Ectothiorhodospiraceae bacterium BW-2]